MIKAVLYDMDGVMIDSEPLHIETTNRILKEYGHSRDEIPQNMQKQFMGRKVVDVLQSIIDYFGLKVDAETLLKKKSEFLFRLIKERLHLFPGMRESLERFRREGLKVALATSGTRLYVDHVLEKFLLQNAFGVVVSADDVRKGKPDPEIYLTTTKRLGLQPRECLVLEDAENGVKAAKRAGCFCIAVRREHNKDQDLSRADKLVHSLEEITLEMVNSLGI